FLQRVGEDRQILNPTVLVDRLGESNHGALIPPQPGDANRQGWNGLPKTSRTMSAFFAWSFRNADRTANPFGGTTPVSGAQVQVPLWLYRKRKTSSKVASGSSNCSTFFSK